MLMRTSERKLLEELDSLSAGQDQAHVTFMKARADTFFFSFSF